MRTLAVVGLGQIGGSIGLALRDRYRIIGVTRRVSTAREAVGRGAVHVAGTDLDAIRSADIVVLATPVRTLLRQIPDVAARLKPGAVLTDVGSTKEAIVRAVPRGTRFVAGHPMAGNEIAGLAGARADLFRTRPWVLLKSPHRPVIERMVRATGARPVLLASAAVHDRIVAECSHLPHLIAYALCSFGADLRYTGNSFRDATRVAKSDVDMVLDFLVTNRHLKGVTQRFARRLLELASADERTLRRAILQARRRRSSL